MRRRDFLASVAAAPIALSTAGSALGEPQEASEVAPKTGRLRQGVAVQALLGGDDRPIEDRCQDAVAMGIKGFDLIDDISLWPTIQKYGLEISLYRIAPPGWPKIPVYAGPVGWDAIGRPEAMGDFLKAVHKGIDYAAAHGVKNMLLQCGARTPSLDYATGADNAVAFCNAVKHHAEDKGIVFQMEILNSKGIGAPKMSMFDHMAWGVEVVKRVNSPSLKILYDIFHAQLMEGDITDTIRKNFQYIGHFHTGGVPGRHEIGRHQELNYHFIAEAIADLNFSGIIAHEWSPGPGRNPLASLMEGVETLTV